MACRSIHPFNNPPIHLPNRQQTHKHNPYTVPFLLREEDNGSKRLWFKHDSVFKQPKLYFQALLITPVRCCSLIVDCCCLRWEKGGISVYVYDVCSLSIHPYNTTMHARKQVITESPETCVLTEMLCRLVTDKLAEFSYNAALAGESVRSVYVYVCVRVREQHPREKRVHLCILWVSHWGRWDLHSCI